MPMTGKVTGMIPCYHDLKSADATNTSFFEVSEMSCILVFSGAW